MSVVLVAFDGLKREAGGGVMERRKQREDDESEVGNDAERTGRAGQTGRGE